MEESALHLLIRLLCLSYRNIFLKPQWLLSLKNKALNQVCLKMLQTISSFVSCTTHNKCCFFKKDICSRRDPICTNCTFRLLDSPTYMFCSERILEVWVFWCLHVYLGPCNFRGKPVNFMISQILLGKKSSMVFLRVTSSIDFLWWTVTSICSWKMNPEQWLLGKLWAGPQNVPIYYLSFDQESYSKIYKPIKIKLFWSEI